MGNLEPLLGHGFILPFINRFAGPDGMYEYDLFAVINHEGQMNNGHYTNFARFGDEVRFHFGLGSEAKCASCLVVPL